MNMATPLTSNDGRPTNSPGNDVETDDSGVPRYSLSAPSRAPSGETETDHDPEVHQQVAGERGRALRPAEPEQEHGRDDDQRQPQEQRLGPARRGDLTVIATAVSTTLAGESAGPGESEAAVGTEKEYVALAPFLVFEPASCSGVIFFGIFPLALRVDGDAVVAPVRRAQVQPEFDGVVGKFMFTKGRLCCEEQVVADMDAWDLRSALAGAHARYQSALLQMNRSLAGNDGSEAGIQRVNADYWKAEVQRAEEMLEKAQLRSPIDGVVATAHVENFAGRRLQYGDTFAEVVDTSSAEVDVAIDDMDAGLLRAGSPAVVKLNSYATRRFRGEVRVVSPKSEMQGESRVFYARVLVPNPDGIIRTGMEGRGKVWVGWDPAGYVLFRRPAMWSYSRLWSWLGW